MSTTTLPSTATTAITATTATITTTPHAAAGSSLPIAPIVAGVVVGIVVLVVIGVGIAFYMRKKRNAKKAEKEERENRVVADQGERNVEGGWVYTGSQQVGHVAGKNYPSDYYNNQHDGLGVTSDQILPHELHSNSTLNPRNTVMSWDASTLGSPRLRQEEMGGSEIGSPELEGSEVSEAWRSRQVRD
ncbi:MAG: hypothetical protein M1813_008809 [Trichoglossum hirsutum]|nr:MAG: hypothetical protein M1813_008809 [Trichoglossum hirsutum]